MTPASRQDSLSNGGNLMLITGFVWLPFQTMGLVHKSKVDDFFFLVNINDFEAGICRNQNFFFLRIFRFSTYICHAIPAASY
mmetsp:Transcript_11368/g.28104  ORF Transcript_11368/g.28104 Transcript_11368/m.28104 type:complete len:82 (-) Transcript_11368:526-771(-)